MRSLFCILKKSSVTCALHLPNDLIKIQCLNCTLSWFIILNRKHFDRKMLNEIETYYTLIIELLIFQLEDNQRTITDTNNSKFFGSKEATIQYLWASKQWVECEKKTHSIRLWIGLFVLCLWQYGSALHLPHLDVSKIVFWEWLWVHCLQKIKLSMRIHVKILLRVQQCRWG